MLSVLGYIVFSDTEVFSEIEIGKLLVLPFELVPTPAVADISGEG